MDILNYYTDVEIIGVVDGAIYEDIVIDRWVTVNYGGSIIAVFDRRMVTENVSLTPGKRAKMLIDIYCEKIFKNDDIDKSLQTNAVVFKTATVIDQFTFDESQISRHSYTRATNGRYLVGEDGKWLPLPPERFDGYVLTFDTYGDQFFALIRFNPVEDLRLKSIIGARFQINPSFSLVGVLKEG